jgi:16S rRNA (uracil1498-N3)-methyltransferase
MHRFYLPPGEWAEPAPLLRGREAHHALHVLRVRRGERVVLLNGAGLECQCEVQDCARDSVRLSVIEKRSLPPLPYQLTLLQALPKGKLIESIIQKATELGVWRIVPLLSERVVAQLDQEDAGQKAAKWQLTAVEAIKQCGSPWLPKVEAPLSPRDFLARQERFALPLVASLQPGSRHPREYFRAFEVQQGRKPESVSVWVGPEGDFTPAELAAIQSAGAQPITLGPLVLRSETAALYCLSILNYELQSA